MDTCANVHAVLAICGKDILYPASHHSRSIVAIVHAVRGELQFSMYDVGDR